LRTTVRSSGGITATGLAERGAGVCEVAEAFRPIERRSECRRRRPAWTLTAPCIEIALANHPISSRE